MNNSEVPLVLTDIVCSCMVGHLLVAAIPTSGSLAEEDLFGAGQAFRAFALGFATELRQEKNRADVRHHDGRAEEEQREKGERGQGPRE